MANMNRINKYRVAFEQIRDPGADILDVRCISMDIYATNVDEAQKKAWAALKVDPEQYEIVLIESMNRPYYREMER